MNTKFIYTKEAEKMIKDALILAEIKGRIKVHEWRNFVDYDIIPLVKTLHELMRR